MKTTAALSGTCFVLFGAGDDVSWCLRVPAPLERFLDVWRANPAPDFHNFAVGSSRPEAADLPVARDGNRWPTPILAKARRRTNR